MSEERALTRQVVLKGLAAGVAALLVSVLRAYTACHMQTMVLSHFLVWWFGYSILGVILCGAILCWSTSEKWGWSLLVGAAITFFGDGAILRLPLFLHILTGSREANGGTIFLFHSLFSLTIIDLSVLCVLMGLLASVEHRKSWQQR